MHLGLSCMFNQLMHCGDRWDTGSLPNIWVDRWDTGSLPNVWVDRWDTGSLPNVWVDRWDTGSLPNVWVELDASLKPRLSIAKFISEFWREM